MRLTKEELWGFSFLAVALTAFVGWFWGWAGFEWGTPPTNIGILMTVAFSGFAVFFVRELVLHFGKKLEARREQQGRARAIEWHSHYD